jgi:predicted Ser/Thr protein kinase
MDAAHQRETRLDLRLGKMAVQKGLITAAQLDEALREQQLGVQRGRKKPRRLGVILSSMHFLTDPEVLSLLEEQEARITAQERQRAGDLLLGRILVDGGFSTSQAVDECLQLQDEAIQSGGDEIPLLGRLLTERGHATSHDIEEALELQKGIPLVCRRCGEQTMSGGMDLSALDSCSRCKGPLEPVSSDSPPRPPAAPTPLPAPPPMQRLGKYSIQGTLGRGGMGEVYEAIDTQLNRQVALKVILGELDPSRRGAVKEVERFIQEARLAARLSKHPNIVSVYEADVADGRHYIAMELIRGRTFAEWRKSGSASLRQQIRVLRTVALAVHYAHEHGVLHRDLNPKNVLVDDELRPYVTDFGLARAEEHEDRIVCGSPAYISPEQARALPGIDRRTDVYSLGAILYEILEGRPPFRESTRAATVRKVIHDPVPPLSSVGRARPFSTVDREIEAVCLKALAKKPDDRHPTTEAFAKDLARWLEKKTVTADTTVVAAKNARIPPAILIAAAAVLAAIFLGGAALLRPPKPTEHPDVLQGDKAAAGGDWAQGFELYDRALRANPKDSRARAGREEVRRNLIAAALVDLDRAMKELDQARQQVEEQKKRPKPLTLDQEQRYVDDRRVAEAQVPKAEERVRSIREQIQRVLTLGLK